MAGEKKMTLCDVSLGDTPSGWLCPLSDLAEIIYCLEELHRLSVENSANFNRTRLYVEFGSFFPDRGVECRVECVYLVYKRKLSLSQVTTHNLAQRP